MNFNIYEKSKKVADKESGVYLIKNTINNKCYVGSSYNIRGRLFWHYSMLLKKAHPNIHLQFAFTKYGEEVFRFVPLLNTPKNYNTILEQWVKDKSLYNCAYNIAIDCKAPNRGRRMTEEEKLNVSKRNKGKIWTFEQKQNLKNVLLKIKKDNPLEFKDKRIKNFKNLDFKGSNNGNSKLSEYQRLDIIFMINSEIRNKDIVKKYPQITSGLITEIKSGRTWKTFQNLINI